jgi:NAD(P)-dependent dehydrogenase (short-subunit alcohol dehydrogenase family)
MLKFGIDLTKQVAVVTGGSQGIGAATAVTLGEAGASVVITYNKSKSKALEVLREIEGKGSHGMVLLLDVQQRDSIDSMVSTIMREFGRIDVLVNNAGVGTASVSHYAAPEDLDKATLEINAVGLLLVTQAVLPIMVQQDYGKIINLSSVGGGMAVFPKFRPASGMSKVAAAFLAKQIVADHPHQRIDAFAVCPGSVNTRMFRESTLDRLSEKERRALLDAMPMRRLIEPQEIADIILFLCSSVASVCRGAVIDASLGLGVRPGLVSEYRTLALSEG